MTDVNLNAMQRPELEQTANDLGVKFPHNASDGTLRKKIAEHLGEPAPDEPTPAAAPKTKRKMLEITIQADSRDKQPVQVGLNGRLYVIKRGEKVTVPAPVVKILENAKRHEYDPYTMKRTIVPAYPFMVHREV
jgi:hypothetical protein